MSEVHYHLIAGMIGYMPNINQVYDSKLDCINTAQDDYDLEDEDLEVLVEEGVIKISLAIHGNEYIEIRQCFDPECLEE